MTKPLTVSLKRPNHTQFNIEELSTEKKVQATALPHNNGEICRWSLLWMSSFGGVAFCKHPKCRHKMQQHPQKLDIQSKCNHVQLTFGYVYVCVYMVMDHATASFYILHNKIQTTLESGRMMMMISITHYLVNYAIKFNQETSSCPLLFVFKTPTTTMHRESPPRVVHGNLKISRAKRWRKLLPDGKEPQKTHRNRSKLTSQNLFQMEISYNKKKNPRSDMQQKEDKASREEEAKMQISCSFFF